MAIDKKISELDKKITNYNNNDLLILSENSTSGNYISKSIEMGNVESQIKDKVIYQIKDLFVNKTGDESIAGVKTFSSLPKLSTYTEPLDTVELAPKKYVDDNFLKKNLYATTGSYGLVKIGARLNVDNGIISAEDLKTSVSLTKHVNNSTANSVKIATLKVDNTETEIYAYKRTTVNVLPVGEILSEGGIKIASITVDNLTPVDIYAPKQDLKTSVVVSPAYATGTKIATVKVDTKSTDLYVPAAMQTNVSYSSSYNNTTGLKVGTLHVNNVDTDIFVPSQLTRVSVEPTYVSGLKIATIAIDGVRKEIYMPVDLITIKEFYGDSSSWYKLYNNGWCEQGGKASGLSNNKLCVCLLKDYINTSYFIQVTPIQKKNSECGGFPNSITSICTNSFLIQGCGAHAETYFWETKGFAKNY